MKIILLENVANLGKLGDVVEVLAGYARNFLIPMGKAKRATEESIKEFELKREQYEKIQLEILEQAKHRQQLIEGKEFIVTAKAGVDGKLFGSISSFDIVAAVKRAALGAEIKKSEVKLPNGPLKTTGIFDISVILHHDVRTEIKVNVTAEA